MIEDCVDRAISVARADLMVGGPVGLVAKAFQVGPEGNLPALFREKGVREEFLGSPAWDLRVILASLIPSNEELMLQLARTVRGAETSLMKIEAGLD